MADTVAQHLDFARERAMMGPGRQRGFTLLEIMVTLAILGVVLSIVYGVFSQTIAGKELAERRGDEASSARAALARIALDLQNARPRTVPAAAAPPPPPAGTTPTPTPTGPTTYVPDRGLFLGRVRTENGVPLDDIAFTTWLRRPTAVTFAAIDFGIVHYYVAPLAPESERLGLYREAIFSLTGDSFDPDQANPANSTLVLAGVSGFDLRFFDGQDWIQEWDSTDSRNFARGPLAVEVTLGVTNEQGETETYQTAVDVPLVRSLQRPQVTGRPTPTPPS